ncbi:hypothetical protein [Pseudoalteromonas fuliginea]|uniref:hypothetical protein n=1 Tax=Pseudoalteromonas fuliginea TaxID=1872678 RepID=UPI00316F3BAA
MNKITLPKLELLQVANEKLKQFPGFIEGMQIESARLIAGNLMLTGTLMLDEVVGIQVKEVYDSFIEEFNRNYTLA